MVFLNTTGDVLNATQQTAFESYIRAGGGYVGVHAAADTEYDWPFYGNLVGAYFASHPAIQQANVKVENRAHAGDRAPAADLDPHRRVVQLPDQPALHRPRAGHARRVVVLRRRRWAPTTRITWCKTFDGGRSFYTGVGHTQESYAEPAFRDHLLGGIRYAAGRTKADCRPETGYTDPLQRLDDRLVAGRAGQLHQLRRHAHLGRRHGPVLVQRQAVHVVLAEARLEADRRRQLRRLRRLPEPRQRPVVGGEQRLRDPDRRHRRGRPHHRRRSTPSSPPTSPPATRRSTRRGSGTPTSCSSRASGCGSSSTARRSTTSPTPTRPATSTATSASRTTAPATTRRSATSGSRSSAARRRAGDVTVQAESFTLGQRRAGVHQGRRQQRPDARLHRPGRLGRRTTASTSAAPPRSGRGSSPAARAARSRSAPARRPARSSARSPCPTPAAGTTFADVTTALTGVPSGTAERLPDVHRHRHRPVRRRRLHVRQVGDARRRHRAGRRAWPASAWTCAAARTADGTQIQLYTCNGSAAQTWTRNGPDAAGAGQVPGRLRRRHGRRHEDPAVDLQRHRRAELGRRAPTARCVNPQSGKCLDVSGNNSADGTGRAPVDLPRRAPTRGGPCPSSTDAGRPAGVDRTPAGPLPGIDTG